MATATTSKSQDHSDQKSSLILVEQLKKLVEEHLPPKVATTPINCNEQKTATPSPFQNRLRRKQIEPQSNTLEKWINPSKNKKKRALEKIAKNNAKENKSKNKITKKSTQSECSPESCDSIVPDTKNKPKRIRIDKKYGVKIPSFQQILQESKELAEYKQQLENVLIESDSESLPASPLVLEENVVLKENLLDCTHLSTTDILNYFNNNLKYMSDVINGKEFSERHDLFHKSGKKSSTLYGSNSSMVFTFDQKDQLVNWMEERFDPDRKLSKYFFMVLLPELCLKIFMQEHSMSYNDAVQYLESRPV